MPRVTIAIPTLVAGENLRRCLISLCRQSFQDFEVIVINNGNSDVASLLPPARFSLRILSPESNIGFGAAVNFAVRSSAAELIACLNDDTEANEYWLEQLVLAMDSSPRVGMCASRIQLLGTATLDSAGMLICREGSSKQRGRMQPWTEWMVSGEALMPSGCAGIYRRGLMEEIGLFDEDFFLYCEDTDLGLRARWAGWECRYAADAVVEHHYSQTAGAFSLVKARFVERNRLWVAIKNFPVSRLLLVPLISLVRYGWQMTALRDGRGAGTELLRTGVTLKDAISVVWYAWRDTLIHLPLLIRKRACCRRLRRIRPTEFSRLLNRYSISAKDLAYSR